MISTIFTYALIAWVPNRNAEPTFTLMFYDLPACESAFEAYVKSVPAFESPRHLCVKLSSEENK